jgi:antitoxin component YwqK of YwqJK toxin-antitoxin module
VTDGKWNGLIKIYYRTGVLSEVSNQIAWEYQGDYTFYHPNGKIKVKGQFKNGKKDGLWEYWNEDGSFREKRELKNGTYKVNTKKYSDDGVTCSRCNFGQYWGGFCTMCGAASPARLREH